MPYIDPIPELKRQAARELAKLLEGWNAHFVAPMIGTDQPRISDIRHGRLKRFSLETLIRYITRMKMRVELRVVEPPFPRKPRPTREK
jgi:predicted XRE-type DNA-binding protein